MSKLKTSFFCQNCGAQYAKWQGQCNSCKQRNTIVEEIPVSTIMSKHSRQSKE